MSFDFLIVILGVVLIVEGIPWFLSPQSAKRVLSQLFVLNDRTLRGIGLCLMVTGLFLVYIVRSF